MPPFVPSAGIKSKPSNADPKVWKIMQESTTWSLDSCTHTIDKLKALKNRKIEFLRAGLLRPLRFQIATLRSRSIEAS
jgi:hypothetical protein